MTFEMDFPASCRLRVLLYGPLEVWKRDDAGAWQPVEKEAWGKGRAARSVFKRLLVAPGRRLSRTAIQDDLWPYSEHFDLMEKTIYNAINQIRRVTGKTLIKTLETSYEVADQSIIWVDRDACNYLLKEVENQGYLSVQALPLLEQACEYLERGELLEGEDGTWVYGVRKTSEDLLRQVRFWLAESYERQGKIWQAGEQYRALQQLAPDEEAALAWIAMLARRGKTKDASTCYHDIKTATKMQGTVLSENFVQRVRDLLALSARMPSTLPAHSLSISTWSDNGLLRSLSILPDEPLDQLLALDSPLPVDKDTLGSFAALTDTCRHLSEGNELRIAERVLWTYLPKIEQLARHRSDYQQNAASIASQGYLLAASLVGHRNDLLGRLSYSKRALYYGELAGDLNLQVVSMRQIAISFDCMDCPEQVIEVSKQTFPSLPETSPLLQACVYAGISGAYAELGQRKETQQYMDLAYERFPAHSENEPGYLHTICRYSTLVFFDGLNMLEFGEPRKAEIIFARLDTQQQSAPLAERVRIEMLNYQIAVFIELGDMERACAYLENATEAARVIGSERYFREDFSLLRQMQSVWPSESRVKALTDLFVR